MLIKHQKKTPAKIDSQKYVYQGSPYNAYKNTRKNKLNEKNKDKNKKRPNRATEIRLSGVPPNNAF